MQAQATSRSERIAALGSRTFDVLVIGGGITGCGIARDASLRGLSVALVEKDDFASGTSSRSSRLIHGGVRYLEHGELHLVFEASAERRRLLKLAPHLVRPLAFTWPVYAGARISRWKLGAGLALYDALALFRNVGRHHRLDRDGVLAEEPMLDPAGLRGGARYFDAATNDARLTLANAIGALEAGAVIVNHCGVESLVIDGDRIAGAQVRDALTQRSLTVHARVVVNATGPWSDRVRALDDRGVAAAPAVRGSKGVHIAVPRERVGNNHALTLLSPRDGRVLFVLPSESHAVIGTTDTYTDSTPDDVRATIDDVRYLLDSANAFFPKAGLSESDVVAAWAGIRPLLPAKGSTPGAASREHAVATSERGLISITGGKLTTYRVMAADVLDMVFTHLSTPRGEDRAKHMALPGGDFASLDALVADITGTTSDVELAGHLAHTYGNRWPDVWREILSADGRDKIASDLPYRIGELRHAVHHEMALTLGDLLIRRTHVAYETRDHGLSAVPRVAAAVAALLDWDAAATKRAVDDYKREVQRIFAIEPSPAR